MEKLMIYFFILAHLLSGINKEMTVEERQIYIKYYQDKIQERSDEEYHLIKEDCVKYSTTSLNIRTLPCTDSDVLGTFMFGEEVHITAKVENSNWVQVIIGQDFGYCNGTYLSNTKPQEKPQVVERNGDIQTVGNIPENFIDEVYKYYNLVDNNVKDKLKNIGWKIYITEENLSTKFGFSFSVLALTYMNDNEGIKNIYISSRIKAKNSILHEIGHAIDLSLGTVSSFEEFFVIYQEEVESFISWHNTHKNNYSTPIEYFAECYQEYILHPFNLKSFCPKTFEYIEKAICNL